MTRLDFVPRKARNLTVERMRQWGSSRIPTWAKQDPSVDKVFEGPLRLSDSEKIELRHQIINHHGSILDFIPRKMSEEVTHEILKFLYISQEWSEDENKIRYILLSSVDKGPAFAEKLKKRASNNFFYAHSIEEDKIKFKEKDSTYNYDDTFPYRHLPYWEKNPKEIDDYKWYFDPLEKTLKKDEIRFKDSFKKILSNLKEPLKEIGDEALVSQLKTSTILSDDSKYHGEEVLFSSNRLKTSKRLRGRRCVIPVGPANERDTVVWDLVSCNTISKIHVFISQIISQLEESCMACDSVVADNRINSVSKTKKFFVVRDIKKCGITFNTELFRFIKEVLIEMYPSLETSRLLECYEDISIAFDFDDEDLGIKKGVFTPIDRGHGLGSANALTTLCQIILDDLIKEDMTESTNKIRSIFYNDDSLVGCDSLKIAQEYQYFDRIELSNFSIIIKDETSSILQNGGVFCEEYFSTFYNVSKDILSRMTLSSQFFVSDIYTAKENIRSMSDEILQSEDLVKRLEDLKEHWGFEWFPEEVNLSSGMGGWTTSTLCGIDASLLDYEELDKQPSSVQIMKAIKAEKRTPRTFIPKRFSRISNRRQEQKNSHFVNDTFIPSDVSYQTKTYDLSLIQWDFSKVKEKFLVNLGCRYLPYEYRRRRLRFRQASYRERQERSVYHECDIYSKYLEIHFPKPVLLPLKYVESSMPDVKYRYINKVGAPLLNTMEQEDQIDLMAAVIKEATKDKRIVCSYYEPQSLILKRYESEGHVMRMKFDKRYQIIYPMNIDLEDPFKMYPLSLLIRNIYYHMYHIFPTSIDPNITMPGDGNDLFSELDFSSNIPYEGDKPESEVLSFIIKSDRFLKITDKKEFIRFVVESEELRVSNTTLAIVEGGSRQQLSLEEPQGEIQKIDLAEDEKEDEIYHEMGKVSVCIKCLDDEVDHDQISRQTSLDTCCEKHAVDLNNILGDRFDFEIGKFPEIEDSEEGSEDSPTEDEIVYADDPDWDGSEDSDIDYG